MTALVTPVCDAAMALRINHEKTEAAFVQVILAHFDAALVCHYIKHCAS